MVASRVLTYLICEGIGLHCTIVSLLPYFLSCFNYFSQLKDIFSSYFIILEVSLGQKQVSKFQLAILLGFTFFVG